MVAVGLDPALKLPLVNGVHITSGGTAGVTGLTSDYTPYGSPTVTASTSKYAGTYAIKVVGDTSNYIESSYIPVSPGQEWTVSAYLNAAVAGSVMGISWYTNVYGDAGGWGYVTITTLGSYNSYNYTATAPAGAAFATVVLFPVATGDTIYADNIQFESGASATAWVEGSSDVVVKVSVPSAALTDAPAIKYTTGTSSITLTLATASSKASKKVYSSAAVPATLSLVTASAKANKKVYSSAAIPSTLSLVTASSRATKKLYSSVAIPTTLSLATASSKANKKLYSSAAIPITTTTTSPILRYLVGTLRGQTIPISIGVPTASSKANKKLYSSAAVPITLTTSSASASVVKIVGISAAITLAMPTVTGRVNYNKASLKPTASVPITITTSTVSSKASKTITPSAVIPATLSLATASSKANKKLYSSAAIPITVLYATASTRVVKITGTSAAVPITVSLATASSKATKKLYSSAAIPITSTVSTTSLRYTLGRLTTQTIPITVSVSSASSKASKPVRPVAAIPATLTLANAPLTSIAGYKYTSGTSAITVTLSTASSKANRKITPTETIAVTTSTLGRVNYNKASFRSAASIPLAVTTSTPSLLVSKRTGGSVAIVLTVPSAASKRYRGLSVNIPNISVTTSTSSMKARWATSGTSQIQLTIPITSTIAQKILRPTNPITITLSTQSAPLIDYIRGLIHAHILPTGPAIKIRNQNPGIEIMGAEGTASITSTTASAKVLSTEPDINFTNKN